MEEKGYYSPEEVAMICEAWRSVSVDNVDRAMKNLRRYEKLAPVSVQRNINRLRDIEHGYYSCDSEIRKSTKEQSDFKKFKEFFEVFDG